MSVLPSSLKSPSNDPTLLVLCAIKVFLILKLVTSVKVPSPFERNKVLREGSSHRRKMSVLPSPLKSPSNDPTALVLCPRRVFLILKLVTSVKVPSPFERNKVLREGSFHQRKMSVLPSPLKSPSNEPTPPLLCAIKVFLILKLVTSVKVPFTPPPACQPKPVAGKHTPSPPHSVMLMSRGRPVGP